MWSPIASPKDTVTFGKHTHKLSLTHLYIHVWKERKEKNSEGFKKQVYTGIEILPERYMQHDVIIKSKSRVSRLQPTGAKSRLCPVFINKVLLEHSHTNLYELCISAFATQV